MTLMLKDAIKGDTDSPGIEVACQPEILIDIRG